jgi:hypothetical protein
MSFQRVSRFIVFSATVVVVGAVTTTPMPAPGQSMSGSVRSNARSSPATGGVAGTVDSLSASSFVVLTSAGQKVSVNKTPSTEYRKGTSSISASAITNGDSVLVLGIVNGAIIMASQVIVQAVDKDASAASAATGVVPFQRGAPSAAKQVGQVPANYSQGSGTIVSGIKANKATESALANYPGGIVDRVVELGDGKYEVHNIGVNWPHHIFVNQEFKVVGAY